MEIERINENTVKFYISYMDIEDRGFDREEIWYNREKSEQLFWEMMEEVHDQEEFNIEGPLWIQVQALDKGLEIIVTKAHISKDGQKLELPTEDGKTIDMPVDEKIESLLDSQFGFKNNKKSDLEEDEIVEIDEDVNEELTFIIRFNDFEDVIQLSHYFKGEPTLQDQLFHFEDNYYLFVQFADDFLTDDEQENILSQLLEFGYESTVTIYRLEEYGKTIFHENAMANVRTYFAQN